METNKEMAEYIYSILRSDLNVMWSWGFNKPTIVDKGLKFKVQGFIFRGWVHVIYNEGSDLFDIKLITIKNVEHVKNYAEAVKKEYSKLR